MFARCNVLGSIRRLVLVLVLVPGGAVERKERPDRTRRPDRTLFVGNSYTF